MITPVDIQSRTFKSGIGYDKKDVDAFIGEILKNYEELYRSNVELKDKVNMLNEGLQHYKTIEASLQKALILAEKTSEETIKTAEDKAKTIEKEAINKAKEHSANGKLELDRVHSQTINLVQQYTKFKSQFNQMLNAQLELINSATFDIHVESLDAFETSTASVRDSLNASNPMAGMGSGNASAYGNLGGSFGASNVNTSFVNANVTEPVKAAASNTMSQSNYDSNNGGYQTATPSVNETMTKQAASGAAEAVASAKQASMEAAATAEYAGKMYGKTGDFGSFSGHPQDRDVSPLTGYQEETENFSENAFSDTSKGNLESEFSASINNSFNENAFGSNSTTAGYGADSLSENGSFIDPFASASVNMTEVRANGSTYSGEVEHKQNRGNLLGDGDDPEAGFEYV